MKQIQRHGKLLRVLWICKGRKHIGMEISVHQSDHFFQPESPCTDFCSLICNLFYTAGRHSKFIILYSLQSVITMRWKYEPKQRLKLNAVTIITNINQQYFSKNMFAGIFMVGLIHCMKCVFRYTIIDF
jgi:hypothetical protein